MVVFSLCPNPSTFLYLSLHICAARLLPLRLWPAWRPRFTNRLVKNTFVSFTYQGPPVAHARSALLALRQLVFISTFELRPVFPLLFTGCQLRQKNSPNAIITMLLSSTHCTLVSSLDRSACFLFSLPLSSSAFLGPRSASRLQGAEKLSHLSSRVLLLGSPDFGYPHLQVLKICVAKIWRLVEQNSRR